MEIFQKINDLPILEVLERLNIGYSKQGANHYLKKDDGTTDTSFSISVSKNMVSDFGKTGIQGGVFDFVGMYCIGISEADMRTNEGRAMTLQFFIEKGIVQKPQSNKEFTKSLGHKELFTNFEQYKLNGYKTVISSFLMQRGVPSNFIADNTLLIGEIFSDVGYYEDYYCTEYYTYKDENGKWIIKEGDNPKTTPIFIFPCYQLDKEGNKTLVGMKLRRKDGKTIRGKKSIAYGKTGLMYNKVSEATSYIVEGEMDYIILQLLGYEGVIGNLGGAQAHKPMLKSLLSETKFVVCLYDNDTAGDNAKLSLRKVFDRPVYEITYPIRENNKGKQLTDINDYYKVGYDNKAKWNKLFKDKKLIGEELTKQEVGTTDFIFIRKTLEYFDTKFTSIQKTSDVASYIGATAKELSTMVKAGNIKMYTDFCYFDGGKPGYYNLMNKETMILDGGQEEAVLHPHIALLVRNVGNRKQENIDWIHRSILYKITHLNDVYIPALILYGAGRSGKGTLINLITQILGSENTLIGLGQRDLESTFDSYEGNKLLVEYKEVSTGNKFEDRKVLDRLKGVIGEARITVNLKRARLREVDNIARFHLSSNHPIPLQLDSKHSGNKRFTVIKTGGSLDLEVAEEMNRVTFKNNKIIRQYVAWLFETYPEVPKLKRLDALDNAEKKQLEENCESASNQFFEWVEKKFPHICKITTSQKKQLLDIYINTHGEDKFDPRFKNANFDAGLSHRYEKKRISIQGKTCRGYIINKTDFDKEHIPAETLDYLTDSEVEKSIF